MFSANSSQVSGDKLFVEDVFSTYLYTGNGSTQNIINGIDLAGKNGMVWIKNRTSSTDPLHYLNFKDGSNISSNNSNNTNSKQVMTPYAAFNSDGFFVNALPGFLNNSGVNYASWTFRKAPKFFDVVTYTGNGTSGRAIAHNLGSAPGCIIIKRTDSTSDWAVYHRSLGPPATNWWLKLNLTDGQTSASAPWADTDPTATTFTVSANAAVNASGATYVAYLYAHDTSSDGLIQCGSYTGNGSTTGPIVTLGWEPQWVMIKNATTAANWPMYDTMRGFTDGGVDATLFANLSSEEDGTNTNLLRPLATGFQLTSTSTSRNASGDTYVYIAIRRGPMRTPTLGTSVFVPWTRTGTGTTAVVSSTTFPPDLLIERPYASSDQAAWFDRLRGRARSLVSNGTTTETVTTTTTNDLVSFNMNGITVGANMEQAVNTNGASIIDYNFRRAPGFFDEVCYTGTGSYGGRNHNLTVTPELIITKKRSATSAWTTVFSELGSGYMYLNTTAASGGAWGTLGTPTVFNPSDDDTGATYVAYLFASCPGVSKVGSYTGNGSSQTINCAFTTGARFVLIKRTDSTGDWYVWDTARGIVAGNDPHLSLNTTAAEVTTDDTIDPDSSGFVVNQVAATNVNVSSATYIYLAIA